MTNNGSNRSVTIGGNVTGSSIVTGNRNIVKTWMQQHPPPAAETVNAASELAALREELARLNVPDRGKLDRAMEDATEEAAKPEPDKEEVAGAVGRVVKYATFADNFSEHAEKLLPRIAALASWLGVHGSALLSMVGLA